MISVADALKRIQETLVALPSSELRLGDALGLVLAEDLFARVDFPPFPQSNMDGYALRFEEGSMPLRIKGESAARASDSQHLTPGSAMRIFTGAPVPEGADTVLMQERAEVRDGFLYARDPDLRPGLFVRPKGSDVRLGECALSQGTLLTPGALGFLAGVGMDRVRAIAPPRVAVLVTGDELAAPGTELRYGQVYESNSVTLRAALNEAGVKHIDVISVGDDPSQIKHAITEALAGVELLLLTGGVSVGEHDYVASALADCGVKEQFHRVRQKPGKPLYFGVPRSGPARAVFGLPGNPSSVLTCFYVYVLPALGALQARPLALRRAHYPLQESLKKTAGLTHFLKARMTSNGGLRALGAQESYRMSSFALSDALLVFEEERTELSAGESVEALFLPHFDKER
jgi:molybdopterin molybdotransferase